MFSLYCSGVAKRVGRGIALLFHDRDIRRGWVVSSTSRPQFTPRKESVPILQEAGWAPGPVWTGGKSRPHRDLSQNRPARSQSLYRLSYELGCVKILKKHCDMCIRKKTILILFHCRSQRPRRLSRRSAAARQLRLWARILPAAWTSVCCECCVLSGRSLCVGMITLPEES